MELLGLYSPSRDDVFIFGLETKKGFISTFKFINIQWLRLLLYVDIRYLQYVLGRAVRTNVQLYVFFLKSVPNLDVLGTEPACDDSENNFICHSHRENLPIFKAKLSTYDLILPSFMLRLKR